MKSNAQPDMRTLMLYPPPSPLNPWWGMHIESADSVTYYWS